MISFLKIENLAIIDAVSLDLGAGLNVLTGETGAGKSIIADAVGLLLGGKGSADMVRTGAPRLTVEGLFEIPGRQDVVTRLNALGIDAGDEGVILRRELSASGRSRSFINGTLVTLPQLRETGDLLADLHGQHQHQSLLRADGQREALDRFSGAASHAQSVAGAAGRLRALMVEMSTLRDGERENARRADNLRSEIAEIDEVAPKPSEEADLGREEALLQHAEEVAILAGEICQSLNEDDASILASLGAVRERLARLAAIDDRTAAALKAVDESRVGLEDALREVEAYRDLEDHDPGRLEEIAGRLASVQRLRRKYGPEIEDVLRYLAEARVALEEVGSAAERLESMEREIGKAAREYARAGGELTALRRDGARGLVGRLRKELKALAMDGCRFEVAFEEHLDPGSPARLKGRQVAVRPGGLEGIEFLISPNEGEDLRPLAKIASGGELSRLMLALRTVSSSRSDRRALIFDEVDAGVGGTVAEAVALRLKGLSRGQQVLCVTHLPQIAALADVHLRVAKERAGGRTTTSAKPLEGQERVEELARMLGSPGAPTARKHAAALISGAKRS